jgi:cyclase
MTWAQRDSYIDELAEGVYAFIQPDGGWLVNNCGFIVGPSGRAVLVDTSSTAHRTKRLMAEVASRSSERPMALVNTHHHPDHTYGNYQVPTGVPVIGHMRCREEVIAAGFEATRAIREPEYGDLELRPPDVTFSDRMTLHLDDAHIELRYAGPAHTSNDVIVWLAQEKILFAGDLAFAGGQPFVLEGSVRGYLRSLEMIAGLGVEVLVPGHGPVVRGSEVPRLLDNLRAYTVFVSDVAREGFADGLSPLQTALRHKDNPYSHWHENERLVGNLHRAFAEVSDHPSSVRLRVPDVWPEMEQFNDGPIGCKA